jgi:coatomer protein complex subunit alpha (xenin)
MSFDKDLRQVRCTFEKRTESVIAAIFISRDKVCTLDNNREITVSSYDGRNAKKWPIIKKGLTKIDNIFPAPLGKILVAADDQLFIYDLNSKRVNHELSVTEVRRVMWNPNYTHCVVITKTSIMILNKNLQVINSQKETSKIKSGCFDEANSFVYSTSTHIKYMFLEGKTTGTFRSIEEPVYVSFFMKSTFFAITRQGEMEIYPVDNTDYLFKIAL